MNIWHPSRAMQVVSTGRARGFERKKGYGYFWRHRVCPVTGRLIFKEKKLSIIKSFQMLETTTRFPGRYRNAHPEARFCLTDDVSQELAVDGVNVLHNLAELFGCWFGGEGLTQICFAGNDVKVLPLVRGGVSG